MTSKDFPLINKELLALSRWFNLQSGVDPAADFAKGGADGLICCNYGAYYKLGDSIKKHVGTLYPYTTENME